MTTILMKKKKPQMQVMAVTECQKANSGLKVFVYTIDGSEHRVYETSKRRAHDAIVKHILHETRMNGLLNKAIPTVELLYDRPQWLPATRMRLSHSSANKETKKMFDFYKNHCEMEQRLENEFRHFNRGGVIMKSTWMRLKDLYENHGKKK